MGVKPYNIKPRIPTIHWSKRMSNPHCKKLLKKPRENRGDSYLALLEYKNAPLDGMKLSPAQLLMGWRLKTKLPAFAQLLKPKLYRKVHEQMTKRQLKQNLYFNFPKLKEGETVRFRVGNMLQPAVVKHILFSHSLLWLMHLKAVPFKETEPVDTTFVMPVPVPSPVRETVTP